MQSHLSESSFPHLDAPHEAVVDYCVSVSSEAVCDPQHDLRKRLLKMIVSNESRRRHPTENASS
jgi:hypothetical protein